MREKQNKKVILWILIAVWMTVIFLFSSQNGEESGKLSQGFLRNFMMWFLPENTPVGILSTLEYLVRKAAHMAEYGILAILVLLQIYCYGWFRHHWKKILAAVIFIFIYALTDEFHQLFIGGRTGQLKDVLIDTCGGLIGAMIVFWTQKQKDRKSENGGNI